MARTWELKSKRSKTVLARKASKQKPPSSTSSWMEAFPNRKRLLRDSGRKGRSLSEQERKPQPGVRLTVSVIDFILTIFSFIGHYVLCTLTTWHSLKVAPRTRSCYSRLSTTSAANKPRATPIPDKLLHLHWLLAYEAYFYSQRHHLWRSPPFLWRKYTLSKGVATRAAFLQI